MNTPSKSSVTLLNDAVRPVARNLQKYLQSSCKSLKEAEFTYPMGINAIYQGNRLAITVNLGNERFRACFAEGTDEQSAKEALESGKIKFKRLVKHGGWSPNRSMGIDSISLDLRKHDPAKALMLTTPREYIADRSIYKNPVILREQAQSAPRSNTFEIGAWLEPLAYLMTDKRSVAPAYIRAMRDRNTAKPQT